jgi:mannose-6-phosphate isomerase-like protein (cupin superfamily)
MEIKEPGTAPGGSADDRATRTPWGESVTRKVAGWRTGGAYSLFEAEVDPKGGPPPHVQHREDECLYVLEGRFEFLIEAVKMEAGPGSMVYVPKGTLHAFENTGDTVGRLLLIQTPGGVYEHLLREVGKPAAEGIPDASTFTGIAAVYGMEVVPLGV